MTTVAATRKSPLGHKHTQLQLCVQLLMRTLERCPIQQRTYSNVQELAGRVQGQTLWLQFARNNAAVSWTSTSCGSCIASPSALSSPGMGVL